MGRFELFQFISLERTDHVHPTTPRRPCHFNYLDKKERLYPVGRILKVSLVDSKRVYPKRKDIQADALFNLIKIVFCKNRGNICLRDRKWNLNCLYFEVVYHRRCFTIPFHEFCNHMYHNT